MARELMTGVSSFQAKVAATVLLALVEALPGGIPISSNPDIVAGSNMSGLGHS